MNNEDEKRSICSLSARNTRSCKAVASEADVVNTGIANANDPCKYTTIRKEETCKLSIRLGVFSRIDRWKNREFSTNLSLSLSLSLYRFHSTGKFPTTRNVRIAISDKWHFRYFCAIQSSDACQRVWLMETNEAGSGIIRKRPGDEIINWNYGGGGGRGVGRNRTTLISSVLFTISRQNGDRDWAVSMLIML